ncbi:MAG: HAMP domain-containing protein, partial [Anaerolineae bacterium]
MGIELDLWHEFTGFSLTLPQTLLGVIVLGLYAVACGLLLFRLRDDFRTLGLRGWLGLLLALLLIIPASSTLVVGRSWEGILLPAVAGTLHAPPSLSLPMMLLVAGVAVFLGAGPGLVAGLWAGVARGWVTTQALNDVMALALWGFVVGWAVHQCYDERIFAWLRRPLFAALVATLPGLMLLSFNRLIESFPSGGLVAIDHAFTLFQAAWLVWLLPAGVAGFAFTGLFLLFPRLRPPQGPRRPSLFSRSLRARFMIVFLPILILGMGLSILAVTRQAIRLARDQALGEMARSAENAAEGIANFYYTGANLLKQFAANPAFLDPALQQQVLENDRQVVPFFQELFLVDESGKILAQAPADLTDLALTEEEEDLVQQALDFQMSFTTHLMDVGGGMRRLTFVQPLRVEDATSPRAALLGRVQINVNPNLRRALDTLQSTRGVGTGFILDARGLIIAHPDPNYLLRPWQISDEEKSYAVGTGRAYETISPEGDRMLTYVQGVVEGGSLVIQLPFSAVLEAATFISNPLVYVQLVIGLMLALIVPITATRITRPLHMLAQAAHQIAQGNLEIPVHISGEDEVARLGRAFEQMRVRLRDRLNDLSLLLRISRSVSATLDLDEGVPLILEGVLEETHAATARFVLLSADAHPRQIFSVGMAHATFPA